MTDRKKNILFIISAYGFFWAMLAGLVILVFTETINAEGTVFELLRVVACWAPTIAILLFRKKLCPNGSVKEFYQTTFKSRLNLPLLLTVTLIQMAIFIAGTFTLTFFAKNLSFGSVFDFSLKTIGMGVLWTVLQGATGEESGWRGFLQPSFEKKHSVIKSSLFVGIIWAFWHTPLWLLEAFTPGRMIQYALSFLLFCVSISVIIGICYKLCRNLFIPVWIHFVFNVFFPVITESLINDTDNYANFMTLMCLFYAVAAGGFIFWHIKKNGGKSVL